MEKLRNYPKRKTSGSEYFFDYDLLEISLMLGTNINKSQTVTNQNNYYSQSHMEGLVNAIAFSNLLRQ